MKNQLRTIITIINPAAGTDSPILSQLNRATQKFGLTNEVLVTQSPQDAARFARRAKARKPDAVVVYGGDGTVTDVATVLSGSSVPLIIIPGGTANVLAKELGIPLPTEEALEILGRKTRSVHLDVASFGRGEMLIRVEAGILAQMVKNADSQLKGSLGILAYPLTALKELANAPVTTYKLTLDGTRHELDGVGLMVANVGNIGLSGVSLQSSISCSDGLLDVIVLRSSDIATLISLGSSAIIGTKKPLELKHWQAKKVHVQLPKKQTVISDDVPFELSEFSVRMKKHHVTVLV